MLWSRLEGQRPVAVCMGLYSTTSRSNGQLLRFYWALRLLALEFSRAAGLSRKTRASLATQSLWRVGMNAWDRVSASGKPNRDNHVPSWVDSGSLRFCTELPKAALCAVERADVPALFPVSDRSCGRADQEAAFGSGQAETPAHRSRPNLGGAGLSKSSVPLAKMVPFSPNRAAERVQYPVVQSWSCPAETIRRDRRILAGAAPQIC